MHEKKVFLNRIRELEGLLDISERKSDILTNLLKEATAEFEQALQKITVSEANFRAIFENVPQAIYILDTDTRQILDCNPFTVRWLGYSRSELISMKVEDILESGTLDIQENIRKAIDNGPIHIRDRRFRKKNGTMIDAEVIGTMVKYQEKECFVALVWDITERKQIEELCRYKELFENVSDPVFINDSHGRFLEVNDVACHRFKYRREELLNMLIKDIAKPGQSDVLSGAGKRTRTGETVQFELRILTRTGETIPFEFHTRFVTFKGMGAVLSVGRDLTVRKKMEESLIKSERLSAVGEMAGGVAHNYNNLLQMIMINGEAALEKLKSGMVKDAGQAIQNILYASQKGAEIVRRIRNFINVKAAETEETETFDLGLLIHDAVELTRPFWKNIQDSRKYRLNYIRPSGCFVKGSSSEIYEVLVNLIKNAIESMPDGGALTISYEIRDKDIYLAFADTGVGISEENLDRIFEPFFTTRGSKSSGLGLASSYGIVRKHRGNMYVESVMGKGALFTVVLPLAQASGWKKNEKESTEQDTKIRFLLIDDEVSILKAMELFFEDSDVEIITAQTAEKGLSIICQKVPDIVLCDLSMDDMNGWEVGRKIMEHCRNTGIPKIPFILYTGLDRHLDTEKIEQSGVDRVVTKPVSCQRLMRIISEVTEGNRKSESK